MASPQIRVYLLPDAEAPEGVRADILDGRVVSFSFEDSEEGSDKVSIGVDNSDLELFERDDLIGGSFLEISWGYPGRMSPPRRVVLKSIKGFDRLTLEGVGLGAQIHREEKCRVWHGKTRSEVVEEIARESGFSGALAEIESTPERIDAINQLGETDARIIRRLASEEGFQFWIDDLGLHWRSRKFDAAPSHRFVWRGGDDGGIKRIGVESNLLRRSGSIRLKGRDPITKKTIEATASADNTDRPTLGEIREVVDPDTGRTHIEKTNATSALRHSSATSEEAIKREAAARFKRSEQEAIKLSIDVVGEPDLRAKGTIQLDGASMLSGLYYVTKCLHRIDGSGYSCSLSLIRDGQGKRAKAAAERGRPQTGERNRSSVSDGQTPEIIERVDPDTGRIRREKRYPKKTTSDPEARE